MRDRIWPITAKASGHRPVCAGAGFTLVEVMLTLAVLGVLIAVSAPSIRNLILDNRIRSQASDLMGNLAIARSESAKLGVRVTVCASTSFATTPPSCTGGGASAWNAGYIMFADVNADGIFNSATDTLLRIGEPLTGGNTLVSSGFTATPAAVDGFQFRPAGNTSLSGPGSFKLCDSRLGLFGRNISISATGRTISTTTTCP